MFCVCVPVGLYKNLKRFFDYIFLLNNYRLFKF